MALKPTKQRPTGYKEKELATAAEIKAETKTAKPAVETIVKPSTSVDENPPAPTIPLEDRNLRLGKFNYKPEIVVTPAVRHGLAAQLGLPAGELPVRQDLEDILNQAVNLVLGEVAAKGGNQVIQELEAALTAAREEQRLLEELRRQKG